MGQAQEFAVSTKGAGGQGRLEVKLTSPTQRAVPCTLEAQPGKASTLAHYIPKEEGLYSVDVTYDGHPILGSPFPVEAMLPPDPSKVGFVYPTTCCVVAKINLSIHTPCDLIGDQNSSLSVTYLASTPYSHEELSVITVLCGLLVLYR